MRVTPTNLWESFSNRVKSTGQMVQVGEVTYAAYWSDDIWLNGNGDEHHIPSMPNIVRFKDMRLVGSLFASLDYGSELAKIALLIADSDQWVPLSSRIYDALSQHEFGIAADPPSPT